MIDTLKWVIITCEISLVSICDTIITTTTANSNRTGVVIDSTFQEICKDPNITQSTLQVDGEIINNYKKKSFYDRRKFN